MGLLQRAAKDRKQQHLGDPGTHSRGFLEHAKSYRTSEEMEQLCAVRLRRLGQSAPHAALTILKTYFPASAGIVLDKNGNIYRISASVGISEQACPDEGLRLPALDRPLPSEGFFVFPSSDLGLGCLANDAQAIAFPFPSNKESTGGCVIFVTNELPLPSAPSIARVVKAFTGPFSSSRGTIPESEIKKNDPQLQNALSVFDAMGDAHILLFRLDQASIPSIESLSELAGTRLGSVGNAVPLSPDRLAVFLKPALDRELYAHQLIKAFNSVFTLKAGEITLERWGRATEQESARSLLAL